MVSIWHFFLQEWHQQISLIWERQPNKENHYIRQADYCILMKDHRQRQTFFFRIMCAHELFAIKPGMCIMKVNRVNLYIKQLNDFWTFVDRWSIVLRCDQKWVYAFVWKLSLCDAYWFAVFPICFVCSLASELKEIHTHMHTKNPKRLNKKIYNELT